MAAVRLAITNAIYFKGSWENKFEKECTHDANFHLLDGSGVQLVKMMEMSGLDTQHGSFSDHDMLQLPYEGGDVVMLVLLPHQNSASALQAVRALLRTIW
jgi:serpin B